MRFFLDNHVDVAVKHALRRAGHECWTAGEAHLHDALDDQLTVYAHDRHAVLVTHDKEFSRRRQKNVVGHHVWLRCVEWEAADLLLSHLAEIAASVGAYDDVFIEISASRVEFSYRWD